MIKLIKLECCDNKVYYVNPKRIDYIYEAKAWDRYKEDFIYYTSIFQAGECFSLRLPIKDVLKAIMDGDNEDANL